MTDAGEEKRAVRIAGCSGGFTDRYTALTRMAGDPDIDVVMGDWLSEMTMTGTRNLNESNSLLTSISAWQR